MSTCDKLLAMSSKSNFQLFIKDIIHFYQQARVPLFRHKKIFRGESRIISTITEDRFAFLLAEFIPSASKILVSPVLRFQIGRRWEKFKPDICVLKKNQVVAFLDLKMDLGFNREFLNFVRRKEKFIKQITGLKAKVKIKKPFTEFEVTVPRFLKYGYVVISDKNIACKDMAFIKQGFPKFKKSELYVLTSGSGLRDEGLTPAKILDRISIHNDEFNELLHKIRESLRRVS